MNSDAESQVSTIFLEASSTANRTLDTGIQRVVRNIARNATRVADRMGLDVAFVISNSVCLSRTDAMRLANPQQNGVAEGFDLGSFPHAVCRRILWFICLLLPSKDARTRCDSRRRRVAQIGTTFLCDVYNVTRAGLELSRHQTSFDRILPDRKARARRAPRIHHVGVGTRAAADPQDQIAQQGVHFDGCCRHDNFSIAADQAVPIQRYPP